MKVAIIYNKDFEGVINRFGILNKEMYSPNTIDKVYKALESGGHNVSIIDGNMHVVEQLQEFMPKVLEGERMGMVFNMAYGIQGESRYTHIPALLEMLGIPYVGSNPSGHALALDKVYTKIVMQNKNIPTPEFWVFNSEEEDTSLVEFPSIVKPKMESVSFGLKVVQNVTELKEAIKFLKEEFKQQILVEKFIPGREFCVGLLGNNPIEVFPVLEIDLNNNPNAIQTYENKISSPKKKICPANISQELTQRMISLSKEAFKSLGLRDFARVDIRLDQSNNIYLLEINSMASLGSGGSYVYAAKIAGYNFQDLVNKMLDVAVVRYFSSEEINRNTNDKKTKLNVRIRSYINSKQEYLDNILKQFVNINTHVRNVEGVNKISDLMKKYLLPLGFTYNSIPQVEVGNFLIFTNTDSKEYDFLFISHLDDTIKISDHKYFESNEYRYTGTGIWEHKSGLVSLIGCIQALRFTRNLRKLKIGILLTSDNSLQGKFARDIIITESNKAKVVIGLHGSTSYGGIVTSRSGSAVYNCHMNLIKTRDSGNVSLATGLITKMVNKWIDLSNKEEGLIIAPSNVNIKSNITEPTAFAEISLSVRFNDLEMMKEIDNKIKKSIPSRYNEVIDMQINGGVRRPSLISNDSSHKVFNIMNKVANDMDIRFKEEHRWSSSDICFVRNDIPKIDGIGPIGGKYKDNNEYVLKYSIREKAAFLAISLLKIKSNMDKNEL